MGQVAQHNAEGQAVEGRNRAKLRNFDRQNQQYLDEIMFDNVKYENEQIEADIAYDNTYQEMLDQWSQEDRKLDSLFAEGDQKLESAIIEMYESDYAGSQTGKTAMRMAGKSAKKLGQYKSHLIHNMMFAQTDTEARKDAISQKAKKDAHSIYNKVRFAPTVGPTPHAPELEAKPSSAGLILGLAGTAVQGFKDYREFKAKDFGGGGGKDLSPKGARDYLEREYQGSPRQASGVTFQQHQDSLWELGNK